jgi:hypothetical protein
MAFYQNSGNSRTDWRKDIFLLLRRSYESTYRFVQARHADVFEYLKCQWVTADL